MKSPQINRRLFARFPVVLLVKVVAKPGGEMTGEILDISMGGALIRVPAALGKEIRLSFELDGIGCVFSAKVVRKADGPKHSYGVEFHRNPEMEMTLKSLLPPIS